jgi:hypothetical protein
VIKREVVATKMKMIAPRFVVGVRDGADDGAGGAAAALLGEFC